MKRPVKDAISLEWSECRAEGSGPFHDKFIAPDSGPVKLRIIVDTYFVALPAVLDLEFVIRGPSPDGWRWDLGGRQVRVVGANGVPRHIEPCALVALSAWALYVRRHGGVIGVDSALASPYTYRTGLLQALFTDPPQSDTVRVNGDFYPLCTVSGGRQVEGLHGGVLRTLHITAADAVEAVGNSISEIVRNAEEHSGSEQPTSFAAGWFRNQRRVTFGVADTGKGILRHLRSKGVATLADDDKQAIEKALQAHVTGAGARGVAHAPYNHGIGLFSTRGFARDSGGEMVILSGGGLFVERHPNPARFEDLPGEWRGTLVGVTIKPHKVGAFALKSSSMDWDMAGGSPWRKVAPPGALVIAPPIDDARFASDKGWYRARRPQIMDALLAGQAVHIDFRNAVYTTQSAVHALLAEPVRRLGPRAIALLSYSGGGQPLRTAVSLVVTYALGDHYHDQQREE